MDTREAILSRTSKGLDVFRYYIPKKDWKLGRNFFNPFYNDTNDSFNIFYDRKHDVYRMKDYGNSNYCGDCFALVGLLNGLDSNKNFVEIVKIIDRDLNLGCLNYTYPTPNITSKPKVYNKPIKTVINKEPKSEPKPKEFKYTERPFSNDELSYWLSYGIDHKTLERYNVVAISSYIGEKRGGGQYTVHSSISEPIYGYINRGYIKIYKPHSKVRFLFGRKEDDNYCFGLDQIPSKGDVLYITGGEKDVLSLAAHGFNAICFNSETSILLKDAIKKLTFMFKHIVLLYDMDSTGLNSSHEHQQQLSEFNVKRMLLPLPGTKEAKDISDYFRLGYSAKEFKNLFFELLKSIYSNTISILKSCEMNFKTPPQESQTIISVKNTPLGAEGNLLCITGGEGSGKSNFSGALLSGALNIDRLAIDTLGIDIKANSDNRAILLYDTEQSESQLYKNSKNIIRRSKITTQPDTFKIYSLVGMARKVRLQAIIESMDSFYHCYGGIHLVVIDGIADLVRGANDESESIAVVEELHRLAGIYNTCIVCVLHLVPNGGKLRGHLGSELQRKSAAIISVDRDKNPEISTIKALKVRDGNPIDVPTMLFSWSKREGMHCYVGERSREDKELEKHEESVALAKELFCKCDYLSYNELSEKIQTIKSIKDRSAKLKISSMLSTNIIAKNNNGMYIINLK